MTSPIALSASKGLLIVQEINVIETCKLLILWLLAQSVEQLTLDQRVRGSSP